ncbi:E3 ubiquitin-protein ligase TRIM38-like [Pteropus vampyrus]|uniref:E3 ubiquitin-protein ligase TRIM38-like n=1 Tax=Pteropus vampyrus TaxID=132908 RepID=A0A6P3QIA4_PTEVA|nr:E3 ubiquitin-protein ligase TRIM38-like [Pteropus vampyrus]
MARVRVPSWEKMKNRRQKIQSDFKNMQSFLREEEKCYLWRLEKENEQVLRKLRDSAASLGQKSHELETCILELERRCAASAQKMLKVRGREGCAPEGWAREPPAWEAGASRRPGSVWPGSCCFSSLRVGICKAAPRAPRVPSCASDTALWVGSLARGNEDHL